MPKQINTAAVGQRLVQLFSLKGRFQPVLDEVIVPVVSVDAEGVQASPAAANAFVGAGGAGAYGFTALQNPTTDKLYRVKAIRWVASANTHYLFNTLTRANLSGGTTTNNTFWQDNRLPGAPTGILHEGTSTNAPTASAAGAAILPSAAGFGSAAFPVDIILGPGTWVVLLDSVANDAIHHTWYWTEEPLVADGYR